MIKDKIHFFLISGILKMFKLATVVKGDQKVTFSMATTLRCTEERYSFPWIAPLYPWYILYNAEC